MLPAFGLFGKMHFITMESLIKLIETLRGKNGCPWDRKQTPETMTVYLVEEVYELVDAIESGNPDEVCEELGDVLFQILFIAGLFQEMGHFDVRDIVNINTEKMIRRHPHVFGNETIDTEEDVRKQWRKIKMNEKNHHPKVSILDSVPAGLPALMRAYRISDRAARTGFDWNDISGVMTKVEEEWDELKSELKQENQKHVAQEFGDVLFTLVNVARFANIHPETALSGSIKKFKKRFKYMENKISANKRNMESVSRDEMDMLWEEAKRIVD